MKTASVALKAHLAGETLTVATLWKVTRTDGTVFGFTDNSRDITYSGTTYAAATGHRPSAIKTSSDLAVDNLDVQSVLSADTITEADIQAGLWDYAAVEIMVVNYSALGDGHMLLRKGWMGDIKTGRSSFVAELRGMMQALQQSVGRIYAPACDADLGDTRCGKSLAGFIVTGSVTTATSARVFTDASRGESNGYFDHGLITWTGGDNTGYQMEVKTSTVAGEITLQQPMPNATVIGDTYSLIAGCNKRAGTCYSKFANIVNFRGFPHVPGLDRLMSGK